MERVHCDQHIKLERPQVLGAGLASKCTGYQVRVVYDPAAAEIRVVGK